jgi:DHA2 family multidrug resistance protein
MFCLLPATRLALQHWPAAEIPDASGLFNLMRNLGGAIGIAVFDTLLQTRTDGHAQALVKRLEAGDPAAAAIVGLPTDMFHHQAMGPIDADTRDMIAPMLKHAALTQSFDEGWRVLALCFVAAVLILPFIRPPANE